MVLGPTARGEGGGGGCQEVGPSTEVTQVKQGEEGGGQRGRAITR